MADQSKGNSSKPDDRPAPSPVVRQVAKNLGIDLATVQGSGPDGAILCKDLYGLRARRAQAAAQHDQPSASLAAQSIATRWGIDLAQVEGSGPEGQIVAPDIYRHRAAQRAQQAAAHAAPRQPSWSPPAGVDPRLFAANPLVEQARQEPGGQQVVDAASKRTPPPTLFSGGDLPPFTASGIDPQELLTVPWFARHAVAAIDSKDEARELIDVYSGPDGDVAARSDRADQHPGNHAYQHRVNDWANEAHARANASASSRMLDHVTQERAAKEQARIAAEASGTYDHMFTRQPRDERQSR
jgi:hypothetical protein